MQYRKKSIIVEAEQFDMCVHKYPDGVLKRYLDGEPTKMKGSRVEFYISTLEGDMIVNQGDWIITGVNGEKYPCKPDIFEKTYDAV